MKILVFSDTHGDFYSLKKAVERKPGADVIIHCGDGGNEAEELKLMYPDKAVFAVRGNCDFSCNLPVEQEITLEGKKIFITHGHRYYVKMGYQNLYYAACEKHADIVCFGHTHIPAEEYKDGCYLINPGSCRGTHATFGYIEITPKGVLTNILRVI